MNGSMTANDSKAVRWFRGMVRRVLPAPMRRGLWAGWVRSRVLFMRVGLQPLRIKTIKLARTAARCPRTPRQVVFVSDLPRSREAKLAYGLQQAGWQVVMLHCNAPTFDANKYCVEVQQYRNRWEALLLAARYTPVVYHVFSCWKFDVAATFIRYKPGKIVFDDYDVMAGMVKEDFARKHYPGQIELERFCLENADGLCCRSLETQYAKCYMGYKYRGKRIFFLDCCWDFADVSPSGVKSPDGEIHVIYCGNFAVEKYLPENDPKGYQLWLVQSFAKQGIHYHLYPPHYKVRRGDFEEKFSEYVTLAERTPFFHLHRSIASDNLVREIAQYDFGILILSRKINGVETEAYAITKYDYAVSNKIFDYLDAGLLIIMGQDMFLHFIASRYGTSIDAKTVLMAIDKKALRKAISPAMKARVAAVKFAYSIRRNVGRLVDFYLAL